MGRGLVVGGARGGAELASGPNTGQGGATGLLDGAVGEGRAEDPETPTLGAPPDFDPRCRDGTATAPQKRRGRPPMHPHPRKEDSGPPQAHAQPAHSVRTPFEPDPDPLEAPIRNP